MGPYGARIREIRNKNGWTQAQIAEFAGVTVRAQRNYEADLRVPNVRYLTALALVDVDVGYILTGEETRIYDFGQMMAFDWLAESLGLDFDFRAEVSSSITRCHQGRITEAERDQILCDALERCRVGVLDSTLLTGIIEAVEGVSEGLPPIKKAGAVALLYRAFRPTGRVDMKAVKDAVALAK